MNRCLFALAVTLQLVVSLAATRGAHSARAAGPEAAPYRIVYAFQGGNDGGIPVTTLLRGATRDLYGTTSFQTVRGTQYRLGNVFRLSEAGVLTVLHTFTGGDGGVPEGTLATDASGNLYGTTNGFGGAGVGTVFRLDPSEHLKVLHDFPNVADGGNPTAGVVLDASGNLYGTAYDGGTTGGGTVYELAPDGHAAVLHTFTGTPDGRNPEGGLLSNGYRAFFGTTSRGGAYGRGSIYLVDSLAYAKSGVLYSFRPAPDGRGPAMGSLIRGADGTFYGTTYTGGTSDKGTVFTLDPAGHERLLHSFAGPPDGANPVSGVVLDKAGNVYGTTLRGGSGCGRAGCGVVFKLAHNGAETILHSFAGGTDGALPAGGLVSAGTSFYGTTQFGGGSTVRCGSAAAGCGTVYQITPNGADVRQ